MCTVVTATVTVLAAIESSEYKQKKEKCLPYDDDNVCSTCDDFVI